MVLALGGGYAVPMMISTSTGSLPAPAVPPTMAPRWTRQTYASVYRAGVGPDAGTARSPEERVRTSRYELERAGRSPATIAKHFSALRTLAAALGTDGVRNVCGAKVARGDLARTASSMPA